MAEHLIVLQCHAALRTGVRRGRRFLHRLGICPHFRRDQILPSPVFPRGHPQIPVLLLLLFGQQDGLFQIYIRHRRVRFLRLRRHHRGAVRRNRLFRFRLLRFLYSLYRQMPVISEGRRIVSVVVAIRRSYKDGTTVRFPRCVELGTDLLLRLRLRLLLRLCLGLFLRLFLGLRRCIGAGDELHLPAADGTERRARRSHCSRSFCSGSRPG